MTESVQSGVKDMRATDSKGSSTGPPRNVKVWYGMAFVFLVPSLGNSVLLYFFPSPSSGTISFSLFALPFLAILFLMLCVWEMAKRAVWKEPNITR